MIFIGIVGMIKRRFKGERPPVFIYKTPDSARNTRAVFLRRGAGEAPATAPIEGGTYMNLTYQILNNHLVEGELTAGREISIRIDQTLTQDSTGTMAYLQFEAMGVPRVKTELSVAYIDHNTIQSGFENARRSPLSGNRNEKARRALVQTRQRRMPPGASGAFRHHPARLCWAPTATPPRRAAWACSPSALAGWMWPLR